MDKEKLLEWVAAAMRRSLASGEKRVQAVPCHRYSKQAYFHFLEDKMPEVEEKRFKEHCRTCLPCLDGLSVAYDELSRIQDSREDEWLLARTKTLLTDLSAQTNNAAPVRDSAPGTDFLEVVVEIYQGFIRLLESNGEILTWRDAPAYRGPQTDTDRETVRILKEFDHPPLSLQVTLKPLGSTESLSLQVSLLDREVAEFLTGAPMELAGPGVREEVVSNEQGEADFVLPTHGEYLLKSQLAGGRTLTVQLRVISGKLARG